MIASKVISTASGWKKWTQQKNDEAVFLMVKGGIMNLKAERRGDGPLRFLFTPTAGGRFRQVNGFPVEWRLMAAAYDDLLQEEAQRQERAAKRAAKKAATAEEVLTIRQVFNQFADDKPLYRQMWDKWMAEHLDHKPASVLPDAFPAALTLAHKAMKAENAALNAKRAAAGKPATECKFATLQRLNTFLKPMMRKAYQLGTRFDVVPDMLPTFQEQFRKEKVKAGESKATVISTDDLIALYHAPGGGEHGVTGELVRWLILTGLRKSEGRLMEWRFIDLDDGSFTIPAAVMKMSRDHTVYLSPRMLEILQRLPGAAQLDKLAAERKGYLFPRHSLAGWMHDTPLGMNTLNELLRDKGITAKDANNKAALPVPATPHDIRRTFSYRARDSAHIDWRLAEFMIAHVGGTKTERSYSSPTPDLMRPAWQRMAEWFETQLSPTA